MFDVFQTAIRAYWHAVGLPSGKDEHQIDTVAVVDLLRTLEYFSGFWTHQLLSVGFTPEELNDCLQSARALGAEKATLRPGGVPVVRIAPDDVLN